MNGQGREFDSEGVFSDGLFEIGQPVIGKCQKYYSQ